MSIERLDINGVKRIFEKIKSIIPTKTSDLDNDSGFVTSQYPVEILNEEQTEANTTPDKYVSDAIVTRELITRMGNMDFKLIDGVPNWSPRGADTWSPFKQTVVIKFNLYTDGNNVASYVDLPTANFNQITVTFSAIGNKNTDQILAENGMVIQTINNINSPYVIDIKKEYGDYIRIQHNKGFAPNYNTHLIGTAIID